MTLASCTKERAVLNAREKHDFRRTFLELSFLDMQHTTTGEKLLEKHNFLKVNWQQKPTKIFSSKVDYRFQNANIITAQLAFTYSNTTMETPEKCVKLFKFNNKDTRTSTTSFWFLHW